jgi:DNA-directed RNA polymerase subunit RPC12/RpoP
MYKYLCFNCLKEFEGESLNYASFAKGESLKCTHCGIDVVPAYNFVLMKKTLDYCFWSSTIGVLSLTFFHYFFGLSFKSYLIIFLLPAIFFGVWNDYMKAKVLHRRPIPTKPKS